MHRRRVVDAAHGIAAGVLARRVDDDRLPERKEARVEEPVVMVPKAKHSDRRRNEFDPCARGVVRVVRFDDIANGRPGAGNNKWWAFSEHEAAAPEPTVP